MPLDAVGADAEWDVIVVGSGAGGGTVAARLAEAGQRVLLLEAGGDPRDPDAAGLPEEYDVPGFHPLATENPAMRWDMFVRHYADPVQQARDPKLQPGGIYYPRASTLGGCTAHNAMITLFPPDEDWDAIAALTGDTGWHSDVMRRYQRKLEQCRHRPFWRLLSRFGFNPTGHGWHGWLPTERAMPPQVWGDRTLLLSLLLQSMRLEEAAPHKLRQLWQLLLGRADPNDRRILRAGASGLCYTPLSTQDHRRFGTRERLRQVEANPANRLRIELNALVTRVILDDDQRAVGVEYLKGRGLYRATPGPGADGAEFRIARCRHEVILAGGAFNTPQLLMLSGIGEAAQLARHGIPVRVDLPGVGRNLQDRYEVAVTSRMARNWRVLQGAKFRKGDRLFRQWAKRRVGLYVSNGAALGYTARSTPERSTPDLFCMALLAHFDGYYPGYAARIVEDHDCLSWTILKARTLNRGGQVALRSNDPREPPLVDFHYFHEGTDASGDDLQAVVGAVQAVRRLLQPLITAGLVAAENSPGPAVQTEAQIADWVRDNAWGHHACGTCAIGHRDAGGVLDSRLRVHGTRGLRVVDASVFPRIPGFFICAAIYLVGEKAADMVLHDIQAEARAA
jgi:choline dehydrogenase